MTRIAAPALAVVLLMAPTCCCTRPASPRASTPRPITDRDWELVSLGEPYDPRGSENRPVTLHLASAPSTSSPVTA